MAEVVSWAAGNGDRSENADYQYGKRRLRQIDGRIRFLTKRIEAAEVVDPEAPRGRVAQARAFFGATVRYVNAAGEERVVSIVGTDEVDLNRNHISYVSPLGRALMRSTAGDNVVLHAPGGTENLTVLEVSYERIAVEPFREPPGPPPPHKKPLRPRSPDEEMRFAPTAHDKNGEPGLFSFTSWAATPAAQDLRGGSTQRAGRSVPRYVR